MGYKTSVNGYYHIQITSANPIRTLEKLNSAGCELYDIRSIDDLNVSFYIKRSCYNVVSNIIKKHGDQEIILKKSGIFWSVNGLLRRPVLLLGVVILLTMVLYLPTRVLFVRVEGNTTVPSRYITEQAGFCGIGFGASRRAVRSEKVKNALLAAIPQLRWVGVNTKGCVAVISVRERDPQTSQSVTSGTGSIIALRDGILSDITVLRGNSLCRIGQAVKQGQVLISAYTDCGICVKAERAEGEVVALTNRTIEAITPVFSDYRGEVTRTETLYSLRIGKKIINFFKDSGISDTTCVKMYKEIFLTLPGGFRLPVSLITQNRVHYTNTDAERQNTDCYQWLSDRTAKYLQNQMLAGEILNNHDQITLLEDVCVLSGMYFCRENIGQFRNEEFYSNEGKTD